MSLNWNPYARNTFRCSVDGRRLGALIARRLATQPALQSVHLIAHSCGSFVSFGVCEALREQRPDIAIQTTFLDPVAIYGGVFWDFGIQNFGQCADFSDAYIDTEDRVPGSNEVLPGAHTFDVTSARKKAGYDGPPHVWPTVYYRQLAQRGALLELRKNTKLPVQYPPGQLVDPRLEGRE